MHPIVIQNKIAVANHVWRSAVRDSGDYGTLLDPKLWEMRTDFAMENIITAFLLYLVNFVEV